jgi:hypothetical protein
MVYGCGCGIVGRDNFLMNSTEMRFFYLSLPRMKSSGVPFTHICEWKRRSPSSGSSSSPGWSLVVATVALGYASIIYLTLSSSNSDSEPTSNSEDFTLDSSDCFEHSQQCYAKGSYGSRTTSRYHSLSLWCPSLLVAWTGCPNIIHIFFVLCSMGWGHPFLDFDVRGSQTQIVMSFV